MAQYYNSLPHKRIKLPGNMWKYPTEHSMYSDSSSTTDSMDSNQRGYIPVPSEVGSSHGSSSSRDDFMQGGKNTLESYKGQVKIGVYVNYGLLTVHVVMGKNFRSKSVPSCDSYCKVSLVPDQSRRTRCKTEVVYESNSPVFDEKFSFELLEEDLRKRLFISVWNKETTRSHCEFLGCMSFGIDKIHSQKKQVNGWYYLLSGDIGKYKHLKVSDRKTGLADRGRVNVMNTQNDLDYVESHLVNVKRGKSGGYGFTLSGSAPVKVCRTEQGGGADRAGLKGGDLIVRLDGENVSTFNSEQVARIIKHSARNIVLEVQRVPDMEPVKLENLDQSPRKPLCHSTPSQDNPRAPARDMDVSPWQGRYGSIRRKTLSFGTQDYGWLDCADPSGDKENNQFVPHHDLQTIPESRAFPQSRVAQEVRTKPEVGPLRTLDRNSGFVYPTASIARTVKIQPERGTTKNYGWLEGGTELATKKTIPMFNEHRSVSAKHIFHDDMAGSVSGKQSSGTASTYSGSIASTYATLPRRKVVYKDVI